MTKAIQIAILAVINAIVLILAFVLPVKSSVSNYNITYASVAPKPPANWDKKSIFSTGLFEVAKVFGRSYGGCQNADADFIKYVNDTAVKAGIDPRISAATIAVESGCNSYAISNRGALGIMQIMIPAWKDKFNFEDINLLNAKDNIRVGDTILAGLIQQYGTSEGIRRYNGLGVGCPSCDGMYTAKILTLARI